MRPLTGELLFEAWERGANAPYHTLALSMLASACPKRGWDELADLSIAERDGELLRLRAMTFGDRLGGCLPCEACGARLEFEVAVSFLIENLRSAPALQAHTMRRATSRDLAAVRSSPDPRRALLMRCLSSDAGEDFSEEAAAEQFNRINEDAEIRLALPCPVCSAMQHTVLDIVRFFWAELRHAVKKLLQEVHELASAYGWSEQSILSMNPARRAIYLDLARP